MDHKNKYDTNPYNYMIQGPDDGPYKEENNGDEL